MDQQHGQGNIPEKMALFAQSGADPSLVRFFEEALDTSAAQGTAAPSSDGCYLQIDGAGLSLVENGRVLRGDFTKMLPRLIPNNLNRELLVKACRGKGMPGRLSAVDATAGLGEDAFLLAAAGFHVQLYERNPVIAALLSDALRRGSGHPALAPIVSRMQLHREDSITALPQLPVPPDVVVLDPMFPGRQKSGLIKKKFQLLHQLEQPCDEENALLQAALSCAPRRVVIKRPLKGPCLAGYKPSYTLQGRSIRYDCIVVPAQDRRPGP